MLCIMICLIKNVTCTILVNFAFHYLQNEMFIFLINNSLLLSLFFPKTSIYMRSGQHNIQSSIGNTGNAINPLMSTELSTTSSSISSTSTATTTTTVPAPLSTSFNIVGRGKLNIYYCYYLIILWTVVIHYVKLY